MLEELTRCPAKESRKRKMDDSEAKAGKEGALIVWEVPASLEGVVEEFLEPPTIDPEVGTRLKGQKLLRLPGRY